MSVPIVKTAPLWNCDADTAIEYAEAFCGAQGVYKLLKYAFLNRACELACAPVHIRPVETSHGLDYAWYTYRPVARQPQRLLPPKTKLPTRWQYVPIPSEIEPIYLGLESDLTEDQARSKAMGW